MIYFRDNIYIIKTLKEFQYIDEDAKDQGANVRQKAKDITNLLQDEGRLREERRARANMRDRMVRGNNGDAGDEFADDENSARRQQGVASPSRRRNGNREEDDLKKAIEESKRSLAQDQLNAEERELQEAIRMSEEEEKKRNQALTDSNATALFDDQKYVLSVFQLSAFIFLVCLLLNFL